MKKTAYSKINLTLEILGTKRGDGFHDICSVMHKIPLGDIIELEVGKGNGKIDFFCSDFSLCDTQDNLAYRAADKYLEEYKKVTGKEADVKLKLEKITPYGAGLGGGSADAACVLDMMSTALVGVDFDTKLKIASELGSDVVFCLEEYKCARCTGRGEICKNIAVLPKDACLVVAKPFASINTKGIYKSYDEAYGDNYDKNASTLMEKALEKENLKEISALLTNDFEDICEKRLSDIAQIRTNLLQLGALGSLMSGSGSAVYGIFDGENKCVDAKNTLLKNGGLCAYAFTGEDFEKMYAHLKSEK